VLLVLDMEKMTSINRSNVNDSYIIIKRRKERCQKPEKYLNKPFKIPLLKYDYVPPDSKTRSKNVYIKEVFAELEYNKVQKVTTKGKKTLRNDFT
jgi:hypothetical protein